MNLKYAVIFEQAYGEAARRFHVPNRPETRYNTGSLGKMFTAVAIAQLVEAGKLNWNDPVAKYLPDFPRPLGDKITLHQLLTHTAGLGDIFGDRFFATPRTKFAGNHDYYLFSLKEPPVGEPGGKFEYSNTGFITLGEVVERVSGQAYSDYVKAHIFTPAGMNSTGDYRLDEEVENVAIGYTKMDENGPLEGPWRNNLAQQLYRGMAAGGGYTTARDLFAFSRALKNGKLLKPATRDLLWAGKVDMQGPDSRYGYGFGDLKRGGQRMVGHTGGFPGVNTELAIYLEQDVTVVVLSNLDPPAAALAGKFIRSLFIPAAATPAAVSAPAAPPVSH